VAMSRDLQVQRMQRDQHGLSPFRLAPDRPWGPAIRHALV